MSRLSRYKESLNRFIRDRSCLFEGDNGSENNATSLVYNIIKNDDLILSILFLTIMNNQNKKNKIILHGYHGASCIEFLKVLINIQKYKEDYTNKYGETIYNEI